MLCCSFLHGPLRPALVPPDLIPRAFWRTRSSLCQDILPAVNFLKLLGLPVLCACRLVSRGLGYFVLPHHLLNSTSLLKPPCNHISSGRAPSHWAPFLQKRLGVDPFILFIFHPLYFLSPCFIVFLQGRDVTRVRWHPLVRCMLYKYQLIRVVHIKWSWVEFFTY